MNKIDFKIRVRPDGNAFEQCIARKTRPKRVHNIELFLDTEVQESICNMYDLTKNLDPGTPDFDYKKQAGLQEFLGYDYVHVNVENFDMPVSWNRIEDTSELQREEGRRYVDEQKGPITSWEEFEKYPWPDPERFTTKALEWYDKNLPEGMIIIAGGTGHFSEYLQWLMGYETLCIALFEQRDLVKAIYERVLKLHRAQVKLFLEFDRVRMVWGSDDMGFKTGPLIGPQDMREFVFPGHKALAEMTHDAGRLYLLHSCGNLELLMDDLINDVKIDAKHSFEDTIEHVPDAMNKYGDRIALLGGIDVDFLCRADENQIRKRVRNTLDKCMNHGGYCLGTGNSVANYIPVENYLVMLDEGRRYNSD